MKLTNDELIGIVVKVLDGSALCNFDTVSSTTAIRFTYAGIRYRVSENLFVEEVKDGCLSANRNALIVENKLKWSLNV